MRKKPIIFLPVESTLRELDYKLNIARIFCQNGFDAIIGNPPFIRDELKFKTFKGIFLEKGANPDSLYYKAVKQNGVMCFCLSDEGASHPAFSVTYEPAVKALKQMQKIFLWGEFQKEDLIERNSDPILCNKYLVTGYPGLEFSYPKYQRFHSFFKPKNLPKEYILVNTNFGSVNGYDINKVLKSCTAMSPETLEMLKDSYSKEEINFNLFKTTLEKLIKSFPNESILIRPHPIEIEQNYYKHFSKYPNVAISKKGTANQVISDAKVVLHSDCTTAMQSYLMGKPVISLAFNYLESIHSKWSLNFGIMPSSFENLQIKLAKILKTGSLEKDDYQNVYKNSKATIEAMFGNSENSTKRIVAIMLNEFESSHKMQPYKVVDKRSLKQKFKLFIRKRLPLWYKVPVAARITMLKFTKKDLLERIEILDQIDGMKNNYSIKKLYPNAYEISVK